MELIVNVTGGMEPGCFGCNSVYCPVMWLSLQLADCFCGSSLGTVVAQKKYISYELLHLPLKTWWKKTWVLIKLLDAPVSQALGLACAGG